MVACPRAQPTWTRCPKRISSLLLAKTRGERSPGEKRKVENGQKWGFQTHFSTFAGKHRRRKKLSVYAEQGRPWNSPFFCKAGPRVLPSQSLELPGVIFMASWSSLYGFIASCLSSFIASYLSSFLAASSWLPGVVSLASSAWLPVPVPVPISLPSSCSLVLSQSLELHSFLFL